MYFWISLILTWGMGVQEWVMKHDAFTAAAFVFVVPLLLLIPRLLYVRGTVTKEWRTYTEGLGLVALLVAMTGTALFHTDFYLANGPMVQYDRLEHIAEGFLTVPLMLLGWIALRGRLGDSRRVLRGVLLVAFVSLFVWEGIQYTGDRLFGSHSFYDFSQSIRQDFLEDILFGTIGLLGAIPFTRRQLPKFATFGKR